MKKTLTKAASLVLVFAMLLSVFAVFAGSSKAEEQNKNLLQMLGGFTQKTAENVIKGAADLTAKVAQKVITDVGQAVEVLTFIPNTITDDIKNVPETINAPLTILVSGAEKTAAINDLYTIAHTFTDYAAPKADGTFPQYSLGGNAKILNAALGIEEVYQLAKKELSEDKLPRFIFDNKYAAYKAQLQKLVSFRDHKFNALLNVYVEEAGVIGAAQGAVAAVANAAKAPFEVAYATIKVDQLFKLIALDIIGPVRLSTTLKAAYRAGTAVEGAVYNVQAAVAGIVNFPTTVGAIGEHVQQYAAMIQSLFTNVFGL